MYFHSCRLYSCRHLHFKTAIDLFIYQGMYQSKKLIKAQVLLQQFYNIDFNQTITQMFEEIYKQVDNKKVSFTKFRHNTTLSAICSGRQSKIGDTLFPRLVCKTRSRFPPIPTSQRLQIVSVSPIKSTRQKIQHYQLRYIAAFVYFRVEILFQPRGMQSTEVVNIVIDGCSVGVEMWDQVGAVFTPPPPITR